MINKTIKGDLVKLALAGNFDFIIQGCNCRGIMGSGIAPQIAEAFGSGADAVRQVDWDYPIPVGSKDRLGGYSYHRSNMSLFYGGTHDTTVINAYTQFNTAKFKGDVVVDYDAIRTVFTKLNVDIKESLDYDASIGIPMIGAGLAGGDWEIIKSIINEVTPDLDITLVEYLP